MDHIIIAQASGIGSIFRVRVPVTVGGKEAPIFQEREVLIVIGFDETTGRNTFTPIDKIPSHINLDDYPEVPLADLRDFEQCTTEGAKLITVLKHGSSKPGFNVQQHWNEAGATPGYKISKAGGFALKR